MNPTADHRVLPEHLSRSAFVYVRQSSREQVRRHQESTRVQLGLCEKAVLLGWRSPRIIQDDLGVSASGYVERPGFQELLARVVTREAGIILCLDASRLSRNSKDWASLFELCGFFKTLIADLDQVYDLSQPNDKLVLGIKGSVSELEIQVMKTRLKIAQDEKAARGELKINLPVGYVYDACDKIVLDPDKRVQQAITVMFRQFARCTSIRQLSMWYRDNQVLFPLKEPGRKNKTRWRIPPSRTLHNLLRHTAYAGAYLWGRTFSHIDYIDGKLVKRVSERREIEEAKVCIRDHHPAYITWEQLLANRAKITENRPRWRMEENQGAIRDGLALLAGLLRCGHCGARIFVGYKTESALYYCDGGHEKGSRRCLSFGSKLIDQRVTEELLRAISPLSVQAAVAAASSRQEQVSRQKEIARLHVQATQYEVDRAFEQFDLCDPRNRLVADSLEARLNEKLLELQNAKERLETVQKAGDALTDQERRQLADLARDFPALWNHPQADPKLKKRILRAAIQEIMVKHEPEQHRLEVTIHWKGGVHSRIHVAKRSTPVGRKADASVVELLRELAAELSDAEIARILNMKKLKTPHDLLWTEERVRSFRRQRHIRSGKHPATRDSLTMNEARAYLGIGHNGIMGLVKRGVIARNQITEFAPWRVSQAELDSEPVQRLVRFLKANGRLPRGGSPKNQLTLFDDEC